MEAAQRVSLQASSILLVSIIIVTYQRTDFCKQTVLRLLPMLDINTELIVVEQGERSLEDFCYGENASQTKYLYLPNPSMVNARNFGTLAAKGEIVLFVDDDVIPLGGLIDAHRSAYSGERVAAVTGRVLSDASELHQRSVDLPLRAQTREGWGLVDFRSDKQGEVYSIVGCNMSFRREVLAQLGGFDPNLRMWRDDADIGFRIWQAGYRVVYEGAAALVHLSAQSGGTRSGKVRRDLIATELALYARHYIHYRDNLYFLYRHFSGAQRLRHMARTYKNYVGVSRWPWRVVAKNLCFAVALIQANRLAKHRVTQPLKPLGQN